MVDRCRLPVQVCRSRRRRRRRLLGSRTVVVSYLAASVASIQVVKERWPFTASQVYMLSIYVLVSWWVGERQNFVLVSSCLCVG
jgi:uncharacterized membrane protein